MTPGRKGRKAKRPIAKRKVSKRTKLPKKVNVKTHDMLRRELEDKIIEELYIEGEVIFQERLNRMIDARMMRINQVMS